MSTLLVSHYYAEVDRIIQYGGSRKETSIRNAFERLLQEYCRSRDFMLIPELEYKTRVGKVVYPDGTVKDALRLDWGYWESKDQYDNLDVEITKKFAKGYPTDNILFEDSQTAVLIQHGEEVARIPMRDATGLDRVLQAFINYVRPEVKEFREALRALKEDLPTILGALRDLIQKQEATNAKFCTRRQTFWEVCQQSINPEITLFDINEMLIQHILTEDIFSTVFNDSQFHRENNIAREIQQIIDTFFTGATRRNTLSTIERYYAVIRRKAASIHNHHEKQKFLKAIYENFYKAYNPKAADRLGIVYTPNEIVRFMIESADYLVHKHFGKLLSDPGVEILDPATGTGTYVTELIEYLPKDKLEYKYKNEIHCNEVAILPYYIANLNIEYTYQQKMDQYEEFQNICLVDTLDHTTFEGKQFDLFSMSVQNTERIQEQNSKTISVIIGNPPYNANQENENDNNKNRSYAEVDKEIKASYVKFSKAQKAKSYDMYTRFFRWASSRISEDGILTFITNSSFINAKNLDGFRKAVSDEFSEIYVIDLGGNIRIGDKSGNVFGIKIGVAISFMIKQKFSKKPCKIFYFSLSDFENAGQKLKFLTERDFSRINFQHIQPDEKNNWINLTKNDFSNLVSVAEKASKRSSSNNQLAIFQLFSLGCVTNRDDWLYDFSPDILAQKIQFFCSVYEQEQKRWNSSSKKIRINEFVNRTIKWTSELESYLIRGEKLSFNQESIREGLYRPYSKHYLYYERVIVHRPYKTPQLFPKATSENIVICFTDPGSEKPFSVIAIDQMPDLHLLGAGCGTQCLPLYRYENGKRIENITDWGLTQFQTHYTDRTITKLDIFHYTYAVLHHPAYRSKYELNLKREFPRLPFYDNFHQWAKWGKQLMDLHIHYETVQPYRLQQIDLPAEQSRTAPKAKLKADKTIGSIILDENTTLNGIPPIAWDYKLGNRSALEWILDQYKEKKPKDPTIRAKFNTYRFADYTDQVIDLLQRVCTVSVETMHIIQQMPLE